MAGPVGSYVQLPDDSANPGKKSRTQSKVIGGNTVHEHFYVQSRLAMLLGVYRIGIPQSAVAAAAQNGTSSGSLWAHVPAAITNKKARIRRAMISSRHVAAFAATAAGRIAMSKFTFTGTASGASVTPQKNDASYPTSILDLRTAATGLTVSLGASALGTAGLVGSLTAVGAYAPVDIDFLNGGGYGDEDDWTVIAPGEGVVFWQDVAGTTSDTRLFDLDLEWDEIDTA